MYTTCMITVVSLQSTYVIFFLTKQTNKEKNLKTKNCAGEVKSPPLHNSDGLQRKQKGILLSFTTGLDIWNACQ